MSYTACIYIFLIEKSPAEYCGLREQCSYEQQLLHECSLFIPSASFIFELVSLFLSFYQFVGIFHMLKGKHKTQKGALAFPTGIVFGTPSAFPFQGE